MNEVDDALYDRLVADGPLTTALAGWPIYHAMSITAGAAEFMVFGKQQGSREYTQGGRKVRSFLYSVKLVAQTLSVKSANTIMAAVDTALTDKPLTLANGYVNVYIRWHSDIEYVEEFMGRVWQNVGAVFGIEVV